MAVEDEAVCTPGGLTVCTRPETQAIGERVAVKLAPLLARKESEILQQRVPPRASAADLRMIQYARTVRVVFSLLNEDASAGGAVEGWALRDALQAWDASVPLHETGPLAPLVRLVRALQSVHDVQLESQVQWYAPLQFAPRNETVREAIADAVADATSVLHTLDDAEAPLSRQDATLHTDHRVDHFMSMDDVRVFINAAQWGLDSYGTAEAADTRLFDDQTLNLVLFLPSTPHHPLRIREGDMVVADPAWVVPQWGGVVVWNRENRAGRASELSPPIPLEDLAEPLRLFTKQLLQLLGLDWDHVEGDDTALSFATQGLLWRRTLHAARGAVETLGSTVRLVQKIPNLGVDTGVRNQTHLALAQLAGLAQLIATPSTPMADRIGAMLHCASQAQVHASRAFFDPSMLAMLYFPNEHKYAVYTPLFGPLLIPLFMALLREVKCARGRRRATAD